MHHMDFGKTYSEKARQELHKNALSCNEQIMETAARETTEVQPLTSHL